MDHELILNKLKEKYSYDPNIDLKKFNISLM